MATIYTVEIPTNEALRPSASATEAYWKALKLVKAHKRVVDVAQAAAEKTKAGQVAAAATAK